jgi:hypothetical protein
MRIRTYVLTGIGAYLLFLLTTIPAAPVVGLLAETLPVTINNASGTVWNGSAGSVDTRRNLVLTNVQWSFLPWHLLLASAALDIDAELNNRPVNTRLSAGISGRLALSELELDLDAADVQPLIALPIGKLSGEFQLRINSAAFKQGEVPRIDGTVDWKRAAVTIAETADLGNIAIIVNENEDAPLAARISNKGGDIALNGNFSATGAGDYSLQLNMKPSATASDNLISSLAMFSKKQRNGDFVLNNKGNLAQLGLM